MDYFSYKLDTKVGQVRLLIADTQNENHTFSDDELEYFLQENGNREKLAAADALEAEASDASRIALRVQRGSMTEDATSVAEQLRQQAKRLRTEAKAEIGPLAASITPGSIPGTSTDDRVVSSP